MTNNAPEYIDPSEVSKNEETPRRYFSFLGYIETTEEERGRVEKALLYDFQTDEVVYAIRPRQSRSYSVIERKKAVSPE